MLFNMLIFKYNHFTFIRILKSILVLFMFRRIINFIDFDIFKENYNLLEVVYNC